MSSSDSDRWKARTKGGILRREFLRYAVKVGQWAFTIWVGAEAGVLLAERRAQQTTRREPMTARNYTITPETGHFTITGAAPRLSVNTDITPPAGSLTLTGSAPRVSVTAFPHIV